MKTIKKLFKEYPLQTIVAVFALIMLPISLQLAMTQQKPQTKAAAGTANLFLSPSSAKHNVSESATMEVMLNPDVEQVTAVELVITYDPQIIQIDDIQPGAFFTDPSSTIGQPVIITSDIATPGQIHYAIGFPLGSDYSSSAVASVATISYTTLVSGTSTMDFTRSGTPKTMVADINSNDVLDTADSSVVTVSQDARLYFGTPDPANPQAVNTPFTIDVLADSVNQQISGIDAQITFDPAVLQVTAVDQGTVTEFTSYPALDHDNTSGTVSLSANIGTGTNPIAVDGSGLVVGTITFNPIAESSSTPINYTYTAGDRNDSNMVLYDPNSQDSTDILAAVTNTSISVTNSRTPVSTNTPAPTSTLTPIPTATPTTPASQPTNTPAPTNTPLPTATHTPTPTATTVPPQSVVLRIQLGGRSRAGVSNSVPLQVTARQIGRADLSPVSATTNSAGEATISIVPGNYQLLVKAPGYLARRFGSTADPIQITDNTTRLDFSNTPLVGGDFNNDGTINEVDYTLHFLTNFLRSSGVADLDGSGQVNNLDYGTMRYNWDLVDDQLL